MTKDADFALLDVPFSLQNSFTTGDGVQSLDGLVMDHELFSLAEMDQDLGVIVEPECILPAKLLRETPFMFVRGRQFATRMIRLKNNKPLSEWPATVMRSEYHAEIQQQHVAPQDAGLSAVISCVA